MANVTLDPQGRLLAFRVVPPLIDEQPGSASAPDWAALFAEAGLEMTNFNPTESRWIPPINSDSRGAWEGVYPQQPQISLRIEAAAYRGRVVWFEMIGPWTESSLRSPARRASGANLIPVVFLLVTLLASVPLARRNLRLGRGDHKGAFRLALFVFALYLLQWAFTANFVSGSIEWNLFGRINLPFGLFLSVVVWLIYLALEPYVRRRWPQRIIGWSRLLAGHARDPLVGRDLLLGGLFAIASSLLIPLTLKWPGLTITQPGMAEIVTLQGFRGFASFYLSSLPFQVLGAVSVLFVLMLLSILLRREWLAFAVSWLVWTLFFGGAPGSRGWLAVGLYATLLLVIQARFGLLATAAYFACYNMTRNYPITSDFSAWYAGGTIFALGVVVAICGYGFYTSLGGQKVFAGKLLEE